uniref:Uncharacterized protein n=1 Tax=Leersia perrieri TaxID=77586 RepID=A0A0D9VV00_9ORYZ
MDGGWIGLRWCRQYLSELLQEHHKLGPFMQRNAWTQRMALRCARVARKRKATFSFGKTIRARKLGADIMPDLLTS